MTPSRTRELLPVMQAYADGKTVQVYDRHSEAWMDSAEPAWAEGVQYRIKPAPRYVPWTESTAPKAIVARKMNADTPTDVQGFILNNKGLFEHGSAVYSCKCDFAYMFNNYHHIHPDGSAHPCGTLAD